MTLTILLLALLAVTTLPAITAGSILLVCLACDVDRRSEDRTGRDLG